MENGIILPTSRSKEKACKLEYDTAGKQKTFRATARGHAVLFLLALSLPSK